MHKTNGNYTTTNIHHTQRPLVTKHSLVFKYETTSNAFDI